jgi:hypothetical protein
MQLSFAGHNRLKTFELAAPAKVTSYAKRATGPLSGRKRPEPSTANECLLRLLAHSEAAIPLSARSKRRSTAMRRARTTWRQIPCAGSKRRNEFSHLSGTGHARKPSIKFAAAGIFCAPRTKPVRRTEVVSGPSPQSSSSSSVVIKATRGSSWRQRICSWLA